MISGIVTLLALIGFLAVVVWVFLIKRREDFDEQAHTPLKDCDELDSRATDSNNGEHRA